MLSILLFHDIGAMSQSVTTVTTQRFTRYLQLIDAGGFRVKTLRQIAAGLERDSAQLAITFDDGNLSDLTVATPELLNRNLQATFFLVTNEIGQRGKLDWQQVKELNRLGMDIGAHTHTHPFLEDVDENTVRFELETSKDELEQRLGDPVTSLAVPGGSYNARIVRLARECGYECICSSKPGINDVKQLATDVLSRNSIHALTSEQSFIKKCSPNPEDHLLASLMYDVTRAVKKTVGFHAYSRFRDFMLDTAYWRRS